MELGGVALGTAASVLCLALTAVIVMAVGVSIVRRLLYICRPNEILIFSGRKHRLPDGSVVGYKVVRRGWAVHIPTGSVSAVPRRRPGTRRRRVAVLGCRHDLTKHRSHAA